MLSKPEDMVVVSKIRPFLYVSLADRRGYSRTPFGFVRKVKTQFGWGVSTTPNFRCDAGDPVFIIENLVKCSKITQKQWDGYLFKFGSLDIRRPDIHLSEVANHAPMLINTHCEEKGEVPNLTILVDDQDRVIFEATQQIIGVQRLLVDYGKKYNTMLRNSRADQQAAKSAELKNRRHRTHNFRCSICDQAMHRKRMLGHLAQCRKRAVVGH